MAQRLELHALLVSLVGPEGGVYFRQPPSQQMLYPCIVYKRDNINMDHANNGLYKMKKRYQLTVISRDVDDDLHEKVAALSLCSYDRSFVAENLNHDVFNLFF